MGGALRLQLGVPIEIIEPALVQIVRWEKPPVPVQMVHRRLERHLCRPHLGFAGGEIALVQIAGRAGGYHVIPSRVSTARTRQQMIEREIVTVAAILASESVAQKHVKASEGRMGRRLHEGLERDHARQLHFEGWAVHRAIVVGDDIHAFEEDRLYRVLPRPQRERVIAQRSEVRVEHQGRKTAGRNMHVQATLLTSLERCRHAADGLVIGQRDRIVKP
jgi:hypothetical protein